MIRGASCREVPARIEISGTEQKRIVGDAAKAAGYGRIGLEAHGVTWSQVRAQPGDQSLGAELVRDGGGAGAELAERFRCGRTDGRDLLGCERAP